MDPIYVTGHRNPDTDSIVAAIAMLLCAMPAATGNMKRLVLDRSPKKPGLCWIGLISGLL